MKTYYAKLVTESISGSKRVVFAGVLMPPLHIFFKEVLPDAKNSLMLEKMFSEEIRISCNTAV